MKRPKRVRFEVSFELPRIATMADAKAYVLDAVATMRGCYRPPGGFDDSDLGDPMWDLRSKTIKVIAIKPRPRK